MLCRSSGEFEASARQVCGVCARIFGATSRAASQAGWLMLVAWVAVRRARAGGACYALGPCLVCTCVFLRRIRATNACVSDAHARWRACASLGSRLLSFRGRSRCHVV